MEAVRHFKRAVGNGSAPSIQPCKDLITAALFTKLLGRHLKVIHNAQIYIVTVLSVSAYAYENAQGPVKQVGYRGRCWKTLTSTTIERCVPLSKTKLMNIDFGRTTV